MEPRFPIVIAIIAVLGLAVVIGGIIFIVITIKKNKKDDGPR